MKNIKYEEFNGLNYDSSGGYEIPNQKDTQSYSAKEDTSKKRKFVKQLVFEARQWKNKDDIYDDISKSVGFTHDNKGNDTCEKCGLKWTEHGSYTTYESSCSSERHVCPGDWILYDQKSGHIIENYRPKVFHMIFNSLDY